MSEKILRKMATELPGILNQLESADPVHRAAAVERIRDFVQMTKSWRGSARSVTRRGFLRAGVGAGFVAMSVGRDDD